MAPQDTICALASGPVPSAIAILRISGPDAGAIARERLKSGCPEPKQAILTDFCDARGTLIDTCLALYFEGPRSYTGEDVLELYVHGGAAVVEHALESLTQLASVRLAEPGEFTRRAFEAGKLDLTQAEAVADLIEAETQAQKAQAQRQLSGGLSDVYARWREELLAISALIEVAIDFPDEGDAPQQTDAIVIERLSAVCTEVSAALADGKIGERIRDGFSVAILGAPNAGKSSLLNALTGDDSAIVTNIPGTTRDVIRVRRIMAGQVVWFADTAGIRNTSDTIEAEGVRRALREAETADITLLLIDGTQKKTPSDMAEPLVAADITVVNKIDLLENNEHTGATHHISAKTGAGLAELEMAIADQVAAKVSNTEAAVITRARHRDRLTEGLAALELAKTALIDHNGPELAAEDVRLAIRALDSIVGRIHVEDILGAVFSQFCIGK